MLTTKIIWKTYEVRINEIEVCLRPLPHPAPHPKGYPQIEVDPVAEQAGDYFSEKGQ